MIITKRPSLTHQTEFGLSLYYNPIMYDLKTLLLAILFFLGAIIFFKVASKIFVEVASKIIEEVRKEIGKMRH